MCIHRHAPELNVSQALNKREFQFSFLYLLDFASPVLVSGPILSAVSFGVGWFFSFFFFDSPALLG